MVVTVVLQQKGELTAGMNTCVHKDCQKAFY